jgi:hypothetical protein
VFLQVVPGEVTPAGLDSLSASGLMANLQQLALYDSELPAACLGGWLRAAGRLTSLQLGLSNVDDLAPLGKLPQLQVTLMLTAPVCFNALFLCEWHDSVRIL